MINDTTILNSAIMQRASDLLQTPVEKLDVKFYSPCKKDLMLMEKTGVIYYVDNFTLLPNRSFMGKHFESGEFYSFGSQNFFVFYIKSFFSALQLVGNPNIFPYYEISIVR